MNLKYYLRGLGVGIVVTALIMGISLGGKKESLSDKEIKLYMNKTKHNGYRKVRCITTNEIFETIKEASIKYNIKASNIVMCCKGKSRNLCASHIPYFAVRNQISLN